MGNLATRVEAGQGFELRGLSGRQYFREGFDRSGEQGS